MGRSLDQRRRGLSLPASFVFLTPDGAFVVVAVVVPLAVLALGAWRLAGVRRLLGLPAPPRRAMQLALLATIAVVGLLAVATAQPAVVDQTTARVRTDAQALFVIDISGSMQASAGPHSPTRLQRAIRAAQDLRPGIPTVPAGIATITDQLLPMLSPVPDQAAFDATLARSLAIESPPPVEDSVVATSLGPLAQAAQDGYFAPTARKRVVVLLTDGESNAFNDQSVASAYARTPGTSLIAIQFWNRDERIYEPGGRPDSGYRPSPLGRVTLDQLAAVTHGRLFGENDLGGAAAALRADLGSGPEKQTGETSRDRPLAPYVALAALLPLGFLIKRRNV